MKKEAGFTALEFTICFLIALIFFSFVVMHLENTLRSTKESALMQELSALRKCVKVFYVFNDGYPRDLKFLMGEGKSMFGEANSALNPDLLKTISHDEYGYPIDPFEVDIEELNQVPVAYTIVAGDVAYSGND